MRWETTTATTTKRCHIQLVQHIVELVIIIFVVTTAAATATAAFIVVVLVCCGACDWLAAWLDGAATAVVACCTLFLYYV